MLASSDRNDYDCSNSEGSKSDYNDSRDGDSSKIESSERGSDREIVIVGRVIVIVVAVKVVKL